MNKKDIISSIAKKAKVTQSLAETFVNTFQDVVMEGLKNGDDINLTGFFSIKKKHRAARVGRNPQTGNPINIAASNVVTIKPGAVLKDSVK